MIYICQSASQSKLIPGLYDPARVSAWGACSLHDLEDSFLLGWVCVVQMLHSISYRLARI